MRRRHPETDEELDTEAEAAAPAAGDLGSILMGAQAGAGNAALAGLLERVERGDAPAEELLPGAERELRGAADRATGAALQQRLAAARVNPFAGRVESGLAAFERRLVDAREYGWLGTDASVLSAELDTLELSLRRAEEEEEAVQALGAVDLRRRPLSERTKKAIMERTAITKPGMLLYAPEDFQELQELDAQLTELQKRLADNQIAVTTARGSLGGLSEVSTAYARSAAANLAEDARKAGVLLDELEVRLKAISERHARANAEDRDKLDQLMEGLEARLLREPRLAMAGGSSRQEIDYLVKAAWLEQHEATQQLAKDEVWHLVTGFSASESRLCTFDLPERMDRWRIHFSLDYAVMQAVDVACSDQDVRDALLGATAGVQSRSHATAEVLGQSDPRNPRYFYNTSRVTPHRDLWGTREGKAAKRNWGANERKLIEAFDSKADELVKLVHDVLEQRKELKAVVVKVGESLSWAE